MLKNTEITFQGKLERLSFCKKIDAQIEIKKDLYITNQNGTYFIKTSQMMSNVINRLFLYLKICKKSQINLDYIISKNTTAKIEYNTCLGETSTEFSIEDLNWVKMNYQKMFHLLNSANKISLALNIYSTAIFTNSFHVKFILYCIGLEGLFVTKKSNVLEQFKRINKFIETKDNKIANIYDVRSTLVHGDFLKINDKKNFIDLMFECEEYLRLCLNKIITNDLLENFNTTVEHRKFLNNL